jgi:UDP-glucose 4-epimerase
MSVKSIIIGSSGYIGRNLAAYLSKKGDEVLCYDRNQLDISDPLAVDVLDTHVDFIYLFAGLTGTAQGFEDFNSYVDINEKGLLNLLTTMRRQQSGARLIFPSSRLVYRGKTGIPLVEDDEKEAKTLYAVNKLACEYILQMYRNAYGLNYTIFRIGVPYGSMVKGGLSYGTLGFFTQRASAGLNISLYGDGSLRRTFTHVEDICEKINTAASLAETNGEVYNIGGENLSLLEVAEQIASKHQVGIEFVDWPDLALKVESGDTIFNGVRLERIIGGSYRYKIETWLSGD